jgi:hypothetical protein
MLRWASGRCAADGNAQLDKVGHGAGSAPADVRRRLADVTAARRAALAAVEAREGAAEVRDLLFLDLGLEQQGR